VKSLRVLQTVKAKISRRWPFSAAVFAVHHRLRHTRPNKNGTCHSYYECYWHHKRSEQRLSRQDALYDAADASEQNDRNYFTMGFFTSSLGLG